MCAVEAKAACDGGDEGMDPYVRRLPPFFTSTPTRQNPRKFAHIRSYLLKVGTGHGELLGSPISRFACGRALLGGDVHDSSKLIICSSSGGGNASNDLGESPGTYTPHQGEQNFQQGGTTKNGGDADEGYGEDDNDDSLDASDHIMTAGARKSWRSAN